MGANLWAAKEALQYNTYYIMSCYLLLLLALHELHHYHLLPRTKDRDWLYPVAAQKGCLICIRTWTNLGPKQKQKAKRGAGLFPDSFLDKGRLLFPLVLCRELWNGRDLVRLAGSGMPTTGNRIPDADGPSPSKKRLVLVWSGNGGNVFIMVVGVGCQLRPGVGKGGNGRVGMGVGRGMN